jgi:hypothetical protein
MKYKKGDKVLVLSCPDGFNVRTLSWPQHASIIGNVQVNHPTASPYCDSYVIEIYSAGIKDQETLREAGYRFPLRINCSGRLLRRDKFCPICENAITTYGERNLITEHGVGTKVCYGSHAPLDL